MSLLGLHAKLTPEVDRDWDLESAEACEGHLVATIVFRRPHIHVVDAEAGMEAESYLFDKSSWRDFLICELDEHSPLVSVHGGKALGIGLGLHRLVPIAVGDLNVGPVTLHGIICAQLL